MKIGFKKHSVLFNFLLILFLLTIISPGVIQANSAKIIKGYPNPNGAFDELYLIQGDFSTPVNKVEIDIANSLLIQDDISDKITLRVLHINDLHSNITNLDEEKGDTHYLSQIVKIIEQARERSYQEKEIVLFTSSGDDHIGYVFDELLGYDSKNFVMSPSYKVLSEAGLDVDVIGNHELDRSPELLAHAIASDSQFPVLSANLIGSNYLNQGLKPPAVIGIVDGLRIGFIGLTTDDEVFIRTKKDDPGLKIADPINTVKNLLPVIDKFSDVVIFLNHLGFNEEGGRHTLKVGDKKIAALVSKITDKPVFIFGAHTHSILNQAGLDKKNIINGVPVFQAGSKGEYLGDLRVELKKSNKRYSSVIQNYTLHKMKKHDDIQDYDVKFEKRVIEPIINSLENRLNEEITESIDSKAISTEVAIAERYVEECLIANFMNDAIVSRSKDFTDGPVDIATFNATGVAGGFPLARKIRIKDTYNIMPYADYILIKELSGSQLKTIIQSNAKRIVHPEELKGKNPVNLNGFVSRGFLHFSEAVRYTIVLGDSASQNKAVSIMINNQPIDEVLNKKFKVAFSTYIAGGAEGWNGEEIPGLEEKIKGYDISSISGLGTARVYRNEIIRYLQSIKKVDSVSGAKKDGRVKVINQ